MVIDDRNFHQAVIVAFTLFFFVFAGCAATQRGGAHIDAPVPCPDCIESIIEGSMVDGDTNIPLAGIVRVRDSKPGTSANSLGLFSIPTQPGTHFISFEFLGYYKHQIEIFVPSHHRIRISVRLKANTEQGEMINVGENKYDPVNK